MVILKALFVTIRLLRRKSSIDGSVGVFSELFRGCLHTVPLDNAVLKISRWRCRRDWGITDYLTFTRFLNYTHTLLIDFSSVLIGVLFPGFIVFLQNEREWSVSVLTHVSQSFLLFRGNTVIETLLRSLSYGPEHFSLSLCCEKSHFTLKILYRDIRDCISRYRYTRWSQMRISRLLGGGF